VLVAVSVAVAIGAAVSGGLLLHRAADIERQTQRTQQLGGLAFQLQDFILRAETNKGVTRSLAAERSRTLLAANAALRSVESHDRDAGARIRPLYVAYARVSTRAFARAAAAEGLVPDAVKRQAARLLARLEARVDAEVTVQAQAMRLTNPQARFGLILAALAAGLVVALLLWQFDMQRRAGRIDRDNVKRSEELMRLKDDFAAAISHELRTPLTSILGYLELLEDNPERSPEDAAHLAVVERNAERLMRLVGDLLLVAEVEHRVLVLELYDVDLNELARECVQAAMPAVDKKHLRFELHGEASERLQGDPVRLAQMMDNLVSNAIKFTPEGGRVTVTTASRDGRAVFEVADSGVGISAADQARLYDRFFRARDAAVQAAPGTGLGLTITKAIVDAHGGSIEATSTVGIGTTFTVLLPRSPAETLTEIVQQPAAAD
jgi:signal transduction histidine kinase